MRQTTERKDDATTLMEMRTVCQQNIQVQTFINSSTPSCVESSKGSIEEKLMSSRLGSLHVLGDCATSDTFAQDDAPTLALRSGE